MKKLVSALLATAMVMGLATMSMAATISYTGSVKAEVNSQSMMEGSYGDFWFDVDYTTVLGEEGSPWSAGAKLRVKPDNTNAFEGAGYIKYNAEMFNASFKTYIDSGIGKDLVDKFGMQSAPGIELNVIPMEGLTATVMVNEANVAYGLLRTDGPDNLPNTDDDVFVKVTGDDHNFNYLAKVVYSLDGLEVGGGYLVNSAMAPDAADPTKKMATTEKSAYNVWGSYKLLDMVTVGGEYSNRTTGSNDATAYMAKVGFAPADSPIALNAKFAGRDAAYFTKDDKGSELFSLADRFWDTTTSTKMATESIDNAYLVSVDGTFTIAEGLKVGANVDYTDLKFAGVKYDMSEAKDVQLGYKAYVSKDIVSGLTVEAGYQSFIDSKVYAVVTATLK